MSAAFPMASNNAPYVKDYWTVEDVKAHQAALAPNGVSDNPADYAKSLYPINKMDTSYPSDGYGFNLGTLFKGWELYNDTTQSAVPTTQATAAGEKAGPNYLLIGGVALVAILLLRR